MVPLFGKEDEDTGYLLYKNLFNRFYHGIINQPDIVPLIRSKLYRTLINFNVMENIDTLDENCHLALLSNLAVYLIQEENLSWRNETLKLLFSTTDMIYFKTQKF